MHMTSGSAQFLWRMLQSAIRGMTVPASDKQGNSEVPQKQSSVTGPSAGFAEGDADAASDGLPSSLPQTQRLQLSVQ
jgi:hypothetical protein